MERTKRASSGEISRLHILEAVNLAFATGRPAPSVRELAAVLDLSTATVQQHVNWLVREGYLTRQPKRARSLALV